MERFTWSLKRPCRFRVGAWHRPFAMRTSRAMTRTSFAAAVLLILLLGHTAHADQLELTRYVNPFIGTAWTEFPTHDFGYDNGNTFPGAAFPMGMVQWSPDTPGTKGVMGG